MSSKLKAASASVFVNIGLLLSKVAGAIITGSVALIAECAHSLFDLFSSLLAFWGIKEAAKPSDEEHQFGHEKFESLSSMLQGLFITLTALFVIYEATDKLLHPHLVENSEIGVILMAISIPIALLTSRYLKKIANKEGGSHALEADSAHFTTDVQSSVSVLIGLVAVWLGFPLGDIIAAYAVSLIMLFVSYKIIKESYLVFMDYSPDKETMEKIKGVVESVKCITYHKLMARRAGNQIFVNLHIQVNKKMTVEQSHELCGKIKTKMKKEVPKIKEVSVHVEPKDS
jgi:cation diffusion facilitator family transporter